MYLKKISEEIIRRYESGDPDGDSALESREVQLLVCQVINRLLKTEHIQVNMPLGENIPPHALIATYDVIPEAITGSETVITCTSLEEPFPGEYWTTPDGSKWVDGNGDYWLVSGEEITLSVIFVSDRIYTIRILDATPPEGITFSDIVTFMTSTDVGYYQFTGLRESDVTTFDIAGISNVQVREDGWQFNYDLDAVSDSDSIIQQAVQATHLAIPGAVGDNTVSIINIQKCVLGAETINPSQSKITLPAQPINLPRGMGVWKLFSQNNPWQSFIPIQSGNYFMYSPNLQSSFDTLTVYEYFDNKTLLLNKSVSNLPDSMQLQLLVVDPETIGPFDLLPIPADMEDTVIVEVLRILQPQRLADTLQDDNPEVR